MLGALVGIINLAIFFAVLMVLGRLLEFIIIDVALKNYGKKKED